MRLLVWWENATSVATTFIQKAHISTSGSATHQFSTGRCRQPCAEPCLDTHPVSYKYPCAHVHAAKLPTQMLTTHDPRIERIQAHQQAYSARQEYLPLLNECIDLLRAVITDTIASTLDDVRLAQHRYDLGAALYEHFMHVNEVKVLVEAETLLRLALPDIPTKYSSPGPGSVLGSVLREIAYDTNSRLLVEEALYLHRQPFPIDYDLPDLERAHCCRELGLTLRVHYRTDTGQEQSLSEGLQQLIDARALFAKKGVIDHTCTIGLASVLLDLYHLQTKVGHLDEAVKLGNMAWVQCGPDHRDFYRVVWLTSNINRVLAWHFDDTVALCKSLETLRAVLVDVPSGWAVPLTIQLVDALRLCFIKQDAQQALSEAAARFNTQLDGLGPDTSPWIRLQLSLAGVLWLRFRLTGAAEDIDDAARAAEMSLFRTKVRGSAYMERLAHLTRCREAQYQAFGDPAHLRDCIILLEQMTQLAPKQSTYRVMAQFNLLVALRMRAKTTGSLIDLDRAITLALEATTGQIHKCSDTPMMLYEASITFLLRFQMIGRLDDLELATAYSDEAVHLCAAHSFNCHNVLNAHSNILRIRHEVLNQQKGQENALFQQKQLTASLPAAHPDRSKILCGLAQMLICIDGPQNVDEGIYHLLDAVRSECCPAYSKLKDVVDVLTYFKERLHHTSHENALKLSAIYSTAISLLPEVASFGLAPWTRLEVISGSGRLTAQGAVHAISTGQHELALEMLEVGRSVFWTQGLRLRTSFADLPAEIGDRLTKITSALGQPMPEPYAEDTAKERELTCRRRLSSEFSANLAEARLLPGFHDLLWNVSFASLARAAEQHPIVVLVAGDNGGSAIIIRENARCIHVALTRASDVTLKALSSRIEMHNRHIRFSRGVRKVQLNGISPTDMYRELWNLVMAPVVDALGYTVSRDCHDPSFLLIAKQKARGRARLRLTLCPTGAMQLPLHAADIYTGDNQICCSDYLVSTYVPSIGALLHAQQTYKPIRRAKMETLIVAVEDPFKGPALLMTLEEASIVRRHTSRLANVVQVSKSEGVSKHIRSASILHMACHGTQSLNDALQSGFFLEDEMLSVSKLMHLDLPRAFLAVLSACETAKGDVTQPDQAIHLAATMLFTGFKSVVVTMWCGFLSLSPSGEITKRYSLQIYGRFRGSQGCRRYLLGPL
jgi:hypothetical protein